MKKIAVLILFLGCSIFSFGQSKVLEQFDDNLYFYKEYKEDGSIRQKGFYFELNGQLLAHDYWVDEVGTRALFNKGELVWIKPKGQPRYTRQEIEYHQMKLELEKLRGMVSLNE